MLLFGFFLITPAFGADVAKIGIVDFQRILDTSSAGKAARAEINKRGKQMEAELKKRGAEIEERRKKFEQESLVMKRDVREQKERELRISINDLKVLQKKYMDDFKIEPTKHTPEIAFDSKNDTLKIKGMSFPADIMQFYAPFLSWVEDYLQALDDRLFIVNVELSYLNSSSSKVLWDFFEMLDEDVTKGKNITVNWIYDEDDDDKQEIGEEFQEDFESLPFNLVQKKI